MATAADSWRPRFLDSVDIEAIYDQLNATVESDLKDLADRYDCELRGQGLFRFRSP